MTAGSEEKCSRKNFGIQVAGKSLTKLGDELTNPKTVLAWVNIVRERNVPSTINL